MLQLTPQSRIFLATQPVDFRQGIDGLAAVCRQVLGENPLAGAVYVFRDGGPVEVAVTASSSGLDVPSTVCGLIRSAAWTKNASETARQP